METGRSTNEGSLGLHPTAPLNLNLLQGIESGKAAIGQGFIGQRPEPFAGLSFGRRRGQKGQLEPRRETQVRTAMPASPIKDEQNGFLWSGSNLLGKHFQCSRELKDVD